MGVSMFGGLFFGIVVFVNAVVGLVGVKKMERGAMLFFFIMEQWSLSSITDFLYMGVREDKAEYMLCAGIDVASSFAVSADSQTTPDCNALKAKSAMKIFISTMAFVGGMTAAYMSMRISDKIQEAWDDFHFGIPPEELQNEMTPAMITKFKAKEEYRRRAELEALSGGGTSMLQGLGSSMSSLKPSSLSMKGPKSPKSGAKPSQAI